MNRKPIRPNLEIAGQPTEADLEALKAEGVTALVNLRRAGEPDQPLDPTAEETRARELGLDYLNVPIGGEPIAEPQVAALSDFLGRHAEGKAVVHCKQGGRAAALALLHLARAEGWPADQVLARGRASGLDLPPPLRLKVEEYLSSQ